MDANLKIWTIGINKYRDSLVVTTHSLFSFISAVKCKILLGKSNLRDENANRNDEGSIPSNFLLRYFYPTEVNHIRGNERAEKITCRSKFYLFRVRSRIRLKLLIWWRFLKFPWLTGTYKHFSGKSCLPETGVHAQSSGDACLQQKTDYWDKIRSSWQNIQVCYSILATHFTFNRTIKRN